MRETMQEEQVAGEWQHGSRAPGGPGAFRMCSRGRDAGARVDGNCVWLESGGPLGHVRGGCRNWPRLTDSLMTWKKAETATANEIGRDALAVPWTWR